MFEVHSFYIQCNGNREELTQVKEFVASHVQNPSGTDVSSVKGRWIIFWVFDLFEDGTQLRIEGEGKDLAGLHLAQAISEEFPTLVVQVGGSYEEDRSELWELRNGHGTLVEESDAIIFRELGFGVAFWEVRDGKEVPPEQRKTWIQEEVQQVEAFDREEDGIVYSPSEQARRRKIIEDTIEEYEFDLQRRKQLK